MAGKVSKNSRTSRTGGAGAALGNHGEQRIIIPLNSGKHAYVAVSGKTRHVATDSQAFLDAVSDLGADRAPRVKQELTQLEQEHPGHGWGATRGRLEAAGVI
jgi:hypothetical protein